MLKTLRKLPLSDQQESLLRITDWLLPHPGVGPERAPLTRCDSDVLEEAKRSLGIKDLDFDSRVPSPLINLFGDELNRVALPVERADAAKRRLGDRGELAVSQYSIEFAASFKIRAKQLGISPSHARDAVLYYDRMAHLTPPGTSKSGQSLSLFEKRITPSSGDRDKFRMLVDVDRRGDILRIQSALRVYEGDVDLSDSTGPLDTLRLFLDVYGIPISINGGEEKRLHLYERIDGLSGVNELRLRFFSPTGVNPIQQMWVQARNNGVDVAYVYLINRELYLESVARHGQHRLNHFSGFQEVKSATSDYHAWQK